MTNKKWEYIDFDLATRNVLSELQKLGEQGWELCVAVPAAGYQTHCILKRPYYDD